MRTALEVGLRFLGGSRVYAAPDLGDARHRLGQSALRPSRGKLGWLGLALLMTDGCGRSPVVPRIPPSSFAPVVYSDIVWLEDGATLGFNHVPLLSISYDPRTGSTSYTAVESLRGWWSVRADGESLQRRYALSFFDASLDRSGAKMACRLNLGGGLAAIPVSGTALELGAATLVSNVGALPRWSGAGDSLVYQRLDGLFSTWIVAASGGQARQLSPRGSSSDWNPTKPEVITASREDSAGTTISRLVIRNLVSGASRVWARSTVNEFLQSRYEPSGNRIAYSLHAIGGGEPVSLWVADTSGANARVLVSDHVGAYFEWHPSLPRIAFLHYSVQDFRLQNSQIRIVDTSTGGITIVAGNAP